MTAFADIDYALGMSRAKVPRAVPVICLEGDITVQTTTLWTPYGKNTTPLCSSAAPISPGNFIKLNVLSSNTSEALEGAFGVERADASGDFAIGVLISKEEYMAEYPSSTVDCDVDQAAEITSQLTNKYYYRGTAWIFCSHIMEFVTPTAGSTAIVPGNAVRPSVGNSDGIIYAFPGLSVADTGIYDDTGAQNNSVFASWIAGHASASNTGTIAVIIGLSPCIMAA